MTEFSQEYQTKVLNHWEKYILEGHPLPDHLADVRPVIFESWKRSKENGVSPLEIKDAKLTPSELQNAVRRNETLISVAQSYINNLYSYVKGSNFIIALTDNRGYVLYLLTQDPPIQTKAKKSGLTVGCNRSEQYAGTNGIGTCLITGQPIQIWGHEHYIEPHHSYVCTAAPIHNKFRTIIGCLDLVGPVEAVNSHTLPMVCAAVDGIEKEMKMREAYEKISIANNQLVSTIQSISTGVIMVDSMGIITHHNHTASQFLKLNNKDLVYLNLANILDFESAPLNLLDLTHDITNKELTINNYLGTKLNLSISASIIYNNRHEKISTVFNIQEQQRLHKMVSKMSGFTARFNFDSIIGNSVPMSEAKSIGMMASHSDSNVLILGESGTGKELMAQSIHNASKRARGPFIAINCGSLPKGLIESELFGYEGGAFTGANKEGQPGKFELASGGTIFLDEIGDMPLELQTTLLRVIQSREIIRIGGKQTKSIDVRIIAATNVDLAESVREKKFRDDLYYRLNVLPIVIPPLRARPDDIPFLADYFLQYYNNSMGKNVQGITPEARHLMSNYQWPGNVRELENVIERALNLAQDDFISKEELPMEIINNRNPFSHAKPGISGSAPTPTFQVRGKELERIIEALEQARGNVTNAADILCISRRTLYRKIEKYNINADDYRF